MENLPINNGNGQAFGYALYETSITAPGILQAHVRDCGQVSSVRVSRFRSFHLGSSVWSWFPLSFPVFSVSSLGSSVFSYVPCRVLGYLPYSPMSPIGFLDLSC